MTSTIFSKGDASRQSDVRDGAECMLAQTVMRTKGIFPLSDTLDDP